MIGVLSKDVEVRAVEEFFELFKTPWEFFVPSRHYDLLISTVDEMPEGVNARALVIYQSGSIQFDKQLGVVVESATKGGWVEWDGTEFRVYCELAKLQAVGTTVLRWPRTGETIGCLVDSKLPVMRIGFDLFSEVAFLLSQGQPPENARVPALDVHISLLRAIMASQGIPFVEVPPVPGGHDFFACLTHDVDFVGIRDHKCDHTMWGFLYRSLVRSLARALRGEMPWSRCLQNWVAAWSLPLVHLGLREDFWLEFDRYQKIESGFSSTFFFIPFKNVAGISDGAPAPRSRAAKYDFAEIREYVVELLDNGFEVGLHGIDAWHSSVRGRAELRRLQEVTGRTEIGTRMHWLYWSHASPGMLDQAGFSYDSTFGYNDAVGFRAGTTQPFRPLGAQCLLELPLNIQDSAMFYSDRMMLSEEDALFACKAILESTSSYGGALTVNWHTRSLSPERLWGDFYARLLREVRKYRVWFGTAQEVVDWFKRRRALRFSCRRHGEMGASVTLTSSHGYSNPSFTVRCYRETAVSGKSISSFHASTHTDHQWNGEEIYEVML